MDRNITQQESPCLVIVKVTGRFTIDGCRAGIESVSAVKDPLCPLLIDDREVDFGGVTPDVLMEVDSIFSAHAHTLAYAKMAALVRPDDLEIAQQWGRLSNAGARSTVAVFAVESEAIDWLTRN